MEKIYGVVVVGCGYMGESHLKGICGNPRIRLVGVVDQDRMVAESIAEKYSVERWSVNYNDFVNRAEVDVAIICTYPKTHFRIAKSFMDNGIAVLCEKPISNNLKEAAEFFDFAMESQTKIVFGHILRYNSTYLKVYEMIKAGAIGSPLLIRISQLKNVNELEVPSYRKLLENCSPIIDCGVHYFDVMRWFTGEDAVSFSGIGQSIDKTIAPETYNYGLVTIHFSNGSVGCYEVGWSKSLTYESTKEFIGPLGQIKIVYQAQRPDEEKSKGNLVIYKSSQSDDYQEINVPYAEKPVNEQLNHFLDMIEHNIDHRPFLKDVYRAMQEVVLAHRSICENRTFYTLDGYQCIQWNPSDVL